MTCFTLLRTAAISRAVPLSATKTSAAPYIYIYILSEGGAKFQNLSVNPQVAYSIASRIRRGKGLLKVRGLQVWGKAEVISQKEREKFQEILDLIGVTRSLKRRGIKSLPPLAYRIIKIKPEKIRYFNLSEGIYYVTWLKG